MPLEQLAENYPVCKDAPNRSARFYSAGDRKALGCCSLGQGKLLNHDAIIRSPRGKCSSAGLSLRYLSETFISWPSFAVAGTHMSGGCFITALYTASVEFMPVSNPRM